MAGMGFMIAAASRGRDNRGRYAEGNTGNYSRMDGDMEMRRQRYSRGRYMGDDDDRRMGNDHSTRMGGDYDPMESRRMGEDDRMDYAPEMRRRRDDRGRYMEGEEARRMDRDPERMHDRENPYGDEPDVYKRQHERSRMAAYGGEISYERPDGNRGNIRYFKGAPEMMGFQQNQQKDQQKEHGSRFDKQTAMEWVEHMEDKEGVKGGQYSWHQAQQYGRNIGIVGEERLIEFYAAMNAMYSDFRPVAKKFGVDKPEFYAMMAKCFIEDPDAVEDKVEAYYQHVVRHEE